MRNNIEEYSCYTINSMNLMLHGENRPFNEYIEVGCMAYYIRVFSERELQQTPSFKIEL